VGCLPGRTANPNGNSGSSKAGPINFFTSQSDKNLTQERYGSKFDSQIKGEILGIESPSI
jgi:hypothetical protein